MKIKRLLIPAFAAVTALVLASCDNTDTPNEMGIKTTSDANAVVESIQKLQANYDEASLKEKITQLSCISLDIKSKEKMAVTVSSDYSTAYTNFNTSENLKLTADGVNNIIQLKGDIKAKTTQKEIYDKEAYDLDEDYVEENNSELEIKDLLLTIQDGTIYAKGDINTNLIEQFMSTTNTTDDSNSVMPTINNDLGEVGGFITSEKLSDIYSSLVLGKNASFMDMIVLSALQGVTNLDLQKELQKINTLDISKYSAMIENTELPLEMMAQYCELYNISISGTSKNTVTYTAKIPVFDILMENNEDLDYYKVIAEFYDDYDYMISNPYSSYYYEDQLIDDTVFARLADAYAKKVVAEEQAEMDAYRALGLDTPISVSLTINTDYYLPVGIKIDASKLCKKMDGKKVELEDVYTDLATYYDGDNKYNVDIYTESEHNEIKINSADDLYFSLSLDLDAKSAKKLTEEDIEKDYPIDFGMMADLIIMFKGLDSSK